MKNDLHVIKNKLINKVIFFLLLFSSAMMVIILLRYFHIGWRNVNILHILSYFVFIFIYLSKDRLKTTLKVHAISITGLVIGLAGLYKFGFGGAFYFCFLPVLIVGFLINRKTALFYLCITIVIAIIISVGYIGEFITPDRTLNELVKLPSAWGVYLMGFFLTIFIIFYIANFLLESFLIRNEEINILNKELYDSKQYLYKVLENIPAIVFIKNAEGKYKFGNKAFSQLHNYKGDIIGKTDFDLFEKELADHFITIDKRILDNGTTEQIEETVLIKEKPETYLTRKSVITNGDNDIIGVAINISENKRLSDELKESEEKYRRLFNNLPIGAFRSSMDGKLLDVNEAGARLFAYSSSNEMKRKIGNLAEDVYNSPEERIETLKLLKGDSQVAIERRFKRADGTFFNGRYIVRVEEKEGKSFITGTFEDITKRIQVQEALHNSENRLNLALMASNEGIWDWNIKNGEVYFSPTFYIMLGYFPNEFEPSYKAWRNLVHPEDIEIAEAKIREHINHKTQGYFSEFRLRKKNNAYKWILGKGQIVERAENGEPIRMIGTHTDIHTEKLIQLELAKNDYLLKEALRIGKIGHWHLDLRNDKLSWSEEVFKICELTPVSFTPSYNLFLDIVHPSDRDKVKETYTKPHKSKEPCEVLHRLIFKNNRIKYVKENYKTLFDQEGNATELIGTIQDVTEITMAKNELEYYNKRLESLVEERTRDLKKNEEKYRLLAENITDVIWILNITHEKFTYISPSIYNLRGYTVEEAMKQTIEVSLTPESAKVVYDKLSKDIPEFVKDPERFSKVVHVTEIQQPCKDGSIIWVEVTGRYRYNKQGEIETINVSRNITDRKKAEQELMANRNQLIQSEKMASLGLLSAGVAHEINNPVTFISGGLSSLKKSLRITNDALLLYLNATNDQYNIRLKTMIPDVDLVRRNIDKNSRMIKNMEDGIDRTINIIESMRVFSSSSENIFTSVNANDAMDNVLVLLCNSYKGRIRVSKKYSKDATISAMPGKLQQIFMNLINNAIQAISGKGEIVLTTQWNKTKDNLMIKIKDSGKGIPKDVREKIFDPFFTTKEVGKGTGLGLYLTYSFIEQHNGTIGFSSKENVGTEFIISLPKKQFKHG